MLYPYLPDSPPLLWPSLAPLWPLVSSLTCCSCPLVLSQEDQDVQGADPQKALYRDVSPSVSQGRLPELWLFGSLLGNKSVLTYSTAPSHKCVLTYKCVPATKVCQRLYTSTLYKEMKEERGGGWQIQNWCCKKSDLVNFLCIPALA